MRESSTDDAWWHRLGAADDAVPADAVAVVAFVVLANAVLFFSVNASIAVRALFGVPLLFFLPGYGLVASLFPGCETLQASRLNWQVIGDGKGSTLLDRGVDYRERLALSFGASVALLPLLAIVLSVVGLPYTLDVLSTTTSGLALLGVTVGVVRRKRLPRRQRFQVPYQQWLARMDRAAFHRQSTVDSVLNVTLAVLMVASVAGVGYAVVTPTHAESYSSVSLLTENAEGELTASGYPETLDQSGAEFVVDVENHEGETTSYTVVGELQHVRWSEDSVSVLRRSEVLRATETVDAGESWSTAHEVQPSLSGQDLRLVYYVYEGSVPAEPSTETAYRHVYISVDVPARTSG